MNKLKYYLPHILTLVGLAMASLALVMIISQKYNAAIRLLLLVLIVDRFDGTLARKFNSKKNLPGISGETLDTITDIVGLTFVPMILFWQLQIFPETLDIFLVVMCTLTSTWKYSRKESFLKNGYSEGAPPVFFTLFLFYFLDINPWITECYAFILVVLAWSHIKYPITSLVTTHWKFGFKSITNYLTLVFFIPVFIYLEATPPIVFWLMLTAILIQLMIYPTLLARGNIKPAFDRNS